MEYPKGLDPYNSRQHLLHHAYSPLISIQSSISADTLAQAIASTQDISILQLFKPYGNNSKYSISNQVFKITNTQLITKNYPSFPIRFEPPLPELISIKSGTTRESSSTNASTQSVSEGSGGIVSLNQLFSIGTLELLLKHKANEASDKGTGTGTSDLYLGFFDKVITSNHIVPFETFNHPITQIFVVDYAQDSLEYLREQIVHFRNFNFPKFFQINDLLMHSFVFYDPNTVSQQEIIAFEQELYTMLNMNATLFPIQAFTQEVETISISLEENSTIEEDLQRISLKSQSTNIKIPLSVDQILRTKLNEFIKKYLIPHMEQKIRYWDDQILQPKKSIANKFFSASRRLFNNEINSNIGFNSHENYYHKSSPEQAIRKLADWSLILKDFKYAYSTYDLIKKDFTNDKAWVYVASSQEMCIVSLLLAQTQQSNSNLRPDKNTLRKVRHDIVEPYMDNLSYTFKSRLNLKSYSSRAHLVVIELLLCMCNAFNISWWWTDLIEKYILKCIAEFDIQLPIGKPAVTRAILYERLGFTVGSSIYLNLENTFLLDKFFDRVKTITDKEDDDDQEAGTFINEHKIKAPINATIVGLSRFRKSAMWYLLSIKEWSLLQNKHQIETLLTNVELVYDPKQKDEWYTRKDLLLGYILNQVGKHPDA
ncbi:uncharacterized protein KQ657_004425 [Scheffersomyces spartinae]|uniref:Trafficking protein particle complex III-specific subunit 85 n=1 Tax=Scheffersomyces spartinae TaxID=45513 RepID=A0A9P8AJG7_9ASCO|nr:uncharacterized protein KQ657_004425 [Scheffersomyces spartinae]KAG7194746.1 hypothetical protein KQ657_004425 [Scheffersomyces spartinae]